MNIEKKKRDVIQRHLKCNHADIQLETFLQILTRFIERLEISSFEMKI